MSLRWAAAFALAAWTCAAAAGAAEIRGRVSHPTRPGAAGGIEVLALGIGAQEQRIERSTRAGSDGSFAFRDLPAPAAYLLRAIYDEFAFPGPSVLFRPGEPETRTDVEIRVFERSGDGGGLRIANAQWVVEYDAGLFHVRQTARVANPGQRVVVVADDQPALLRIALAPGHGDPRTLLGRLPTGVTLAEGHAEVRGPVFPGEQGFHLELSYDLQPEAGAALNTELSFPDPVEDFSLFVEDFGIEIDAGALHPSRPVRQNDVFYQQFLGFDLAPGERFRLRVAPLEDGAGTSRMALALAASLGVGALAFFVGRPVIRSAEEKARPAEPEPGVRGQLDAALMDLEHDYETGKLSADDRERLREDLRRDALRALTRERGSSPEPCSCGQPIRPDDRFCPKCGRAL
ncbi:MAG: hypothetical protein J4G09_12695 [Proteobacteria bacterium]|nr:hypothetical protein [Pseudomonadota bacterium]